MTEFLARLKQRKLVQWALAYIAASFALIQVLDVVASRFDWPVSLERSIILVLAVGFVVALVIAWYHGEKGRQRVSGPELLLLALVLAIGGGAVWYFGRGAMPPVATPVAANAAANTTLASSTADASPATLIPAKSVAVLPFVNESGDKDQQYFSDGLSEDLITTLSQFSGLKVISRDSSFRFRSSQESSAVIGEKLGVAHLLEGSVQRAGDTVRISAELVNAADGSTLWSQRYDRPYKDLFALQDEITKEVAGALQAQLLANGAAAIHTDRPPSGNLDAYAAYLQGKFFLARGGEADLRKAIGQYAVATRIDPGYAVAWAESSRADNWLAGLFLGGAEAQRFIEQSRQAANTALKLEPDLAAAHSARGELLSAVDFDWNGAEAEFRRALQLEPNNTVAMENLGISLAGRGHPEQAIELTRRSLATDPLRAIGYFLLSRYFTSLGRFDEAEQSIRKAINLQPASGVFDARLVEVEVQRGDAKAALATAERTLPGIWQDYALALARQIGSDRAAADEALKLVIDKHSDGMAFQIAEVFALRRDADQTFAWLDRAFANRDPGIQFLLINPFILRYRDDPRFAAFCKKVGLPTTTDAKAMP